MEVGHELNVAVPSIDVQVGDGTDELNRFVFELVVENDAPGGSEPGDELIPGGGCEFELGFNFEPEARFSTSTRCRTVALRIGGLAARVRLAPSKREAKVIGIRCFITLTP